AEHAHRAGDRAARVLRRTFRVVGFAIPVMAPLPDIAVHLAQSPTVEQLLTHRPGFASRMRLEPGIARQLGLGVAETIFAGAAGATGIFPFRLGRETVTLGVEVAFPGLEVVCGPQSLQLGTPVAEADGIRPLSLLDRVLLAFVFRAIDP